MKCSEDHSDYTTYVSPYTESNGPTSQNYDLPKAQRVCQVRKNISVHPLSNRDSLCTRHNAAAGMRYTSIGPMIILWAMMPKMSIHSFPIFWTRV